jgi:hypothetical protein
MSMILAGIPVVPANSAVTRLSMVMWGPSGAGKTTWACSAPGRKLIINFDPDGYKPVAHRDDVDVLDLADQDHKILAALMGDDPLRLSEKIAGYDTIILDSMTAMSQVALERGVALAKAHGGKASTPEFPGLQGYGARTAITVSILRSLLRVTGRHDKHFIVITHEDDPTTDDNGNTLYITMMLGGKIKNNVALQVSEIWFVDYAEGKGGKTGERRVLVRPGRGRQPMKTRMFREDAGAQMVLKYNADKPDEGQDDTLAALWDRWLHNSKQKIGFTA